jgi:hypothetical protein
MRASGRLAAHVGIEHDILERIEGIAGHALLLFVVARIDCAKELRDDVPEKRIPVLAALAGISTRQARVAVRTLLDRGLWEELNDGGWGDPFQKQANFTAKERLQQREVWRNRGKKPPSSEDALNTNQADILAGNSPESPETPRGLLPLNLKGEPESENESENAREQSPRPDAATRSKDDEGTASVADVASDGESDGAAEGQLSPEAKARAAVLMKKVEARMARGSGRGQDEATA